MSRVQIDARGSGCYSCAVRIAQVAPLFEAVPPGRYGGTERVVHFLTEALVARGHDVTLYASGESRTSARLRPMSDCALWRLRRRDPTPWRVRMHAEVFARAGEYDVIHNHDDWLALPFLDASPTPVVTTVHGRVDLPELRALLGDFPRAALVAISDAQRASLPGASWVATVHHGLPVEAIPFSAAGGEPLVFLGRMSPEKGADVAIDVAVAAGLPLILAARIAPDERAFFDERVRPRLGHPLVRFIGEVDETQKRSLLGSARALLSPIDWPEPFGLVMIEAMACGTPVVTRPCGAAPEIVRHGVTGFLASDRDGLVEAVRAAGRLDRAACRRHVERRFSAQAMAARYERLYETLAPAALAENPAAPPSDSTIAG